MKTIFALALALSAAPLAAQPYLTTAEMTGDHAAVATYDDGALASDAIMNGSYEAALAELLAHRDTLGDDPAWLINVGQVYAATGRISEARAAFARAMTMPSVDLMMVDDVEMDSNRAAARALAALNDQIAMR